jgi:hypothetical protein
MTGWQRGWINRLHQCYSQRRHTLRGLAPIYNLSTYSLSKTNINLGLWNTVFRIDENYSVNRCVCYIQFLFYSQTYGRDIPSPDTNTDTNYPFTIILPFGYWLSSLWMPSQNHFNIGAIDVVFGYQNFTRTVGPAEAINIDPKGWAQAYFVAGSSN